MFKKYFPKLISGVILDAIAESNTKIHRKIYPYAFIKAIRDVHKDIQASHGAIEYGFEIEGCG